MNKGYFRVSSTGFHQKIKGSEYWIFWENPYKPDYVYSWDIETHCYEKPSKSAQIAIAQVVK